MSQANRKVRVVSNVRAEAVDHPQALNENFS